MARASLLLAAGRPSEAANEFAAAEISSSGLAPAQRLRWAELLFELGRNAEASTALHGIATGGMNGEQRARTAALTGSCLLAERPLLRD